MSFCHYSTMLNVISSNSTMSNVILLKLYYVKCHYVEFYYVECHFIEFYYVECLFIEFYYVECHFVEFYYGVWGELLCNVCGIRRNKHSCSTYLKFGCSQFGNTWDIHVNNLIFWPIRGNTTVYMQGGIWYCEIRHLSVAPSYSSLKRPLDLDWRGGSWIKVECHFIEL
jgi:hypothetical protein